MARTTAELVAGIVEVDESIDLDPFIDTANALVTRHCTGDNGPEEEYDEDHLELIERWLAAHFYKLRDPVVQNERAGSVGQSFAIRVDLGLNQTPYGQHAMILDDNGGLRVLADGKIKRRVGVYHVGNREYEET